jgi:pimeloyl-ACP methyl ester carboxylesterase
VLLSIGGSGAHSRAYLPGSLKTLLEERRVSFLTFDKPGISAPFSQPGEVRFDEAALKAHTQGDLVDCAERALDWSQELFPNAPSIHVRGHSEGALIALDLLGRVLRTHPDQTRQIETLVLSGTPIEPYSHVVQRQVDALLPQAPRLRQSVKACSWPHMRHYLGFSCEYLHDAYARPAGRQTFEALSALGARARFVVLQGDADAVTPMRYLREFEKWNAEAGRLELEVSHYRGGHAGSASAERALNAILARITAPE